MAKRTGIIIANSVSYGSLSSNKRVAVARTVARQLSAQLQELGKDSVQTTTIIDEAYDDAYRRVRESIKKASKSSDLLLIYYFGHAVKPLSSPEGLFLYFKDSDWLEPPSMLDFADIAKWLASYNPKAAVIILDCCYAGAVSEGLDILNAHGGDYYAMASVSHKGRALVDHGTDPPIGFFTSHMLTAFKSPGARENLSTEVTFKSYFDYVKSLMVKSSLPVPVAIDGGLGAQLFFTQSLETPVPEAIRQNIPVKSTYRKLFSLINMVLSASVADDHELYLHMAAQPPREFLTPFKVGKDRIEYRAIGEDAFETYLYLGRTLGMLKEGRKPTLSPLGNDMRKYAGAEYNKLLYKAVVSIWRSRGIEMSDLHNVIGQRLKLNGIPDVDAVFLDLYVNKSLRIGKTLFRILLDLTGYVGGLRYSRGNTFFLPAPED